MVLCITQLNFRPMYEIPIQRVTTVMPFGTDRQTDEWTHDTTAMPMVEDTMDPEAHSYEVHSKYARNHIHV